MDDIEADGQGERLSRTIGISLMESHRHNQQDRHAGRRHRATRTNKETDSWKETNGADKHTDR